MIFLFQIVIIVFAIGVTIVVLGSRSTHSGRAWKKIGILLLAVGMVVGVLFPGLVNTVANMLGIGRGADLLLYATAVAFIGYVLNAYLHQQDQRDALYRLARKVAILEANERYNIKD